MRAAAAAHVQFRPLFVNTSLKSGSPLLLVRGFFEIEHLWDRWELVDGRVLLLFV